MATVADSAATIDIAVEAGDWPGDAELRRIAERAFSAVAGTVPDFPRRSEISLLFTDDRGIAQLNADWRGKEGPTNVLSFPAARLPGASEGQETLGDIALGFETVSREAAIAHLTLTDHISHLLVHGLLHLLSYDHGNDVEAKAMEALEIEILAELGIADPYAGSEPELIGTAGGNG